MISQQKASSPPKEDFHVVQGTLLSSKSCSYLVQEFLGEGTFGKVAKCLKTDTNKMVAVKIIKNNPGFIRQAKGEVFILTRLKALDTDKCNLVRYYGSFIYRGNICLEFELLEMNLIQFMRQRVGRHLPLKEIRPILHQLATALRYLKHIGIVHSDVKPENIMMVDHLKQPLRVKLIDLGVAFKVTRATGYPYIQSRWYRSPEIMLGLPFSEAIDMWSLGCVAAALFVGCPLYQGSSEYDMLRYIVETQGQLPDHVLSCGTKTRCFFNRQTGTINRQWRLKTPAQYRTETGVKPRETRRQKFTSLDDLQHVMTPIDQNEEDTLTEVCDRREFVDLLKKMLQLNASRRIKPSQVLQHPFISMSHLVDSLPHSTHVKACHRLMAICSGQSVSGEHGRAMQQAFSTTSTLAQQKDLGRLQAPQCGPSHQEQLLNHILNLQPSKPGKKILQVEFDVEARGSKSSIKTTHKRRTVMLGCTEERQRNVQVPPSLPSASEPVPCSLEDRIKLSGLKHETRKRKAPCMNPKGAAHQSCIYGKHDGFSPSPSARETVQIVAKRTKLILNTSSDTRTETEPSRARQSHTTDINSTARTRAQSTKIQYTAFALDRLPHAKQQ